MRDVEFPPSYVAAEYFRGWRGVRWNAVQKLGMWTRTKMRGVEFPPSYVTAEYFWGWNGVR